MNCIRCNKRFESSTCVNQMCQECLNDSQTIHPTNFGFAQGWLCPKCGAVLAPTQNYCVFCAPDPIIPNGTGRIRY